jgi:hypothetical protein|nr:MAG TPA: hypothetical protein [Caudoviricetes sp.]
MKIYDPNDEITTAYELQDKFVAYERDNYPLGLYAALLEYLQKVVNDEIYELDVIGMDCDIQAASGFEEIAEIVDDDADALEELDWEDVVDRAATQVDYFLFADEANKTIYFF